MHKRQLLKQKQGILLKKGGTFEKTGFSVRRQLTQIGKLFTESSEVFPNQIQGHFFLDETTPNLSKKDEVHRFPAGFFVMKQEAAEEIIIQFGNSYGSKFGFQKLPDGFPGRRIQKLFLF